jgi:hypothetical protein
MLDNYFRPAYSDLWKRTGCKISRPLFVRPREHIMEAEVPRSAAHRLDWRFFLLAVPMAIAAPLLADCFQSFPVVGRGFRLYQATLSLYSDNNGRFMFTDVAVFVGVRAIITLFLLRFLVKRGLPDRIAWLCFLVFWTLVNFFTQSGVHR